MLSRSKVPEIISESVYFDPQSLVYSAFVVVVLVVGIAVLHIELYAYREGDACNG